MTSLRFMCAAGVFIISSQFILSQAWAAQCVNVTLRDENGISIKTEAQVVGLIIEGVGPVINQDVPPMATVEPGLPTECPAELLTAVEAMFSESCLTDKTRAETAKANNQPLDVINQRCQSIYGALNSKK